MLVPKHACAGAAGVSSACPRATRPQRATGLLLAGDLGRPARARLRGSGRSRCVNLGILIRLTRDPSGGGSAEHGWCWPVPGYHSGIVLCGDSGEFDDTGLCSRATEVSWGTKSKNGKDLAADTLSTGCAQ